MSRDPSASLSLAVFYAGLRLAVSADPNLPEPPARRSSMCNMSEHERCSERRTGTCACACHRSRSQS